MLLQIFLQMYFICHIYGANIELTGLTWYVCQGTFPGKCSRFLGGGNVAKHIGGSIVIHGLTPEIALKYAHAAAGGPKRANRFRWLEHAKGQEGQQLWYESLVLLR